MARKVFFSFHYKRDLWRVNIVRNSAVVEGVSAAGFHDESLWEEAKREGEAAIKRLIDKGLEGTSVTVVLIGAETANRKFVTYEIEKSISRGNGILGVRIDNIRTKTGEPPMLEQFQKYWWESAHPYTPTNMESLVSGWRKRIEKRIRLVAALLENEGG